MQKGVSGQQRNADGIERAHGVVFTGLRHAADKRVGFKGEIAVIANFLQRGHDGRPVDIAVEGHGVLVAIALVVGNVQRVHSVAEQAQLHALVRGPDVGMARVLADADVGQAHSVHNLDQISRGIDAADVCLGDAHLKARGKGGHFAEKGDVNGNALFRRAVLRKIRMRGAVHDDPRDARHACALDGAQHHIPVHAFAGILVEIVHMRMRLGEHGAHARGGRADFLNPDIPVVGAQGIGLVVRPIPEVHIQMSYTRCICCTGIWKVGSKNALMDLRGSTAGFLL